MNFRVAYIIARDEWRYWLRSRLSLAAVVAASILIVAALISTITQVETERTTRENFQAEAINTFEDQPARHPHRMIHYGHYVFRTPAPLSVIDLGIDAAAGTVMFLEGHRQNSAVFTPNYSSANAGQLAELSPAFSYQVLTPLLLIILGFASISRERESATETLLYSISVTPLELWIGKIIALFGAALVSLLPLSLGLGFAVTAGEHVGIAAYMLSGYALYLLTWVFIITAMSSSCQHSSTAFTLLLAGWIFFCIVMSPVASGIAMTAGAYEGKVGSDIAVQQALRSTGDGHNEADPAFNQFKMQLLQQYKVESIESLPINIRGIISQKAEEEQTQILNQFSNRRMEAARIQSRIVYWLGLMSPALALRNFSMNVAGTSLNEYQRFQHQAENVRFDFVQRLNKLHAEELSYSDDINRSKDHQSEQRTRINPVHWKMLQTVAHHEDNEQERVAESFPHFITLFFWCVFGAIWSVTRAIRGAANAA